jgi:hypothetical protein
MSSVTNVQIRSPRSKAHSGSGRAQRSTAQPVWGDVLGKFVAATLRAQPTHLYLVSPWIAETDHARIDLLTRHAAACQAEIVLITRSVTTKAAERAMDMVRRAPRSRIIFNEALHAKLYVCQEANGRGVALVGSANLTPGGTRLDEVGVLLRPLIDSSIIDDLARVAATTLCGSARRATTKTRRTA